MAVVAVVVIVDAAIIVGLLLFGAWRVYVGS